MLVHDDPKTPINFGGQRSKVKVTGSKKTAGGCKIDLGRGVMQLGGEELPLGGVSTDERVELDPKP